MKPNISLIKLFIKLLVLMIVVAVLFIISAFLYSARYWPDIYNYVNSNITIKRIPTISELNLTVYEVFEYSTESYSTTDIDYSEATTDTQNSSTEDYVMFEFEDFNFPKAKMRRAALEDIGQDYSEVPTKGVLVDYSYIEDESSTKVIKDLIDESKLTAKALKDVEILSDTQKFEGHSGRTIRTCNGDKPNLSGSVFPWIASIFVKNDSKNTQFEYFCDGALVSDRVVLTTARCVFNSNGTINHENFIVITGKTSLHASGKNENILRVKAVRPHQNFTLTDDEAKNDLAVLILEDAVAFNDGIEVACFKPGDKTVEFSGEAITTAWSLSGDLTLIYFDKEKSKACGSDNKVENTLCATYGNEVALCPSYGGMYVSETRDNSLYLQGLRHGNPLDRGICYTKDVTYTILKPYINWIEGHVKGNKD